MKLLVLPLLVSMVATEPPRVDWSAFVGRWEGQGTFQGKPATGRLGWEDILSGKFRRLTISIALSGQTAFEGHAYYQSYPLSGTWFDSQGSNYGIAATFAGDSLVSLWGPDQGRPAGRSVYRLEAADRLTVTDYIQKAGQWQPFARIEYRRAETH